VRTIEKILSVDKRTDTKGKDYFITTAIVDGDECEGYGKDFKVGDKVMAFFDERYNKAKMQKNKGI
jgi:hypothetical protein